MFALVDLRHVRKLNDWNDSLVSGVEVLTRDYDKIDEIGDFIHHHIDYEMKAETIKQIYPEIFEWIALFDTNVAVLLIITTCVCLVTMMSIFFIIVLEQTQTIGILKTMGMRTREVVGTFVLVAGDILLLGHADWRCHSLVAGLLATKIPSGQIESGYLLCGICAHPFRLGACFAAECRRFCGLHGRFVDSGLGGKQENHPRQCCPIRVK